MTTQLYFSMEAVKGKVLLADANKLTRFAEYELINGTLEIPCASMDKVYYYRDLFNTKKFKKEYKIRAKVHRFYQTIDGGVKGYYEFIYL